MQTLPVLPTDDKTAAGDKDDIYQQDGDYIKDIEVNDLKNRYTLTKGSTQKMVNINLQTFGRSAMSVKTTYA